MVPLVPVVSMVTPVKWADQVLKERKAVQDRVGNPVLMEHRDQEGLKVIKETRVHQDQDLKDAQERRDSQDVPGFQV